MGITMNQRTITVMLYQGDDLDQLGELHQAARTVKPADPPENATAVEHGEYATALEQYDLAAAAYDELYVSAKSRAVEIGIKPLPRKAWQRLVLEHPPRDDFDRDQAVGINEATFAEPLLLGSLMSPFGEAERAAYIAALVAGSELPPCPERMEFLDSLTFAQFDVLYQEAFATNRTIFAPKAPLLVSERSPSSDETSNSPDDSD